MSGVLSFPLLLFLVFLKVDLFAGGFATYFAKCLKDYGPDVRETETVNKGIQTRVEEHNSYSEFKDALKENRLSYNLSSHYSKNVGPEAEYEQTVDPQHARCRPSVVLNV